MGMWPSHRSAGGFVLDVREVVVGGGVGEEESRQTQAWQGSRCGSVGVRRASSRSRSRCQPRCRPRSMVATRAGQDALSARAWAVSGLTARANWSSHSVVRRWVVSAPSATAGVRWRAIRHHRAAAAWSSGSGPCAAAWSIRPRALMPLLDSWASLRARTGAKSSTRIAGEMAARVSRHSSRAADWLVWRRCSSRCW